MVTIGSFTLGVYDLSKAVPINYGIFQKSIYNYIKDNTKKCYQNIRLGEKKGTNTLKLKFWINVTRWC